MKKTDNRGFMLAETLIVTTFVAGILIYIFIQYSNLSRNYNDSYKYNQVEKLYALQDVADYIVSDNQALQYIQNNIDTLKIINISNCSNFTNVDYCKKLFELENINKIVVTTNQVNKDSFSNFDQSFIDFASKINKEGNQQYRVIAKFNDSTFATIRFSND